MCISAARKYMTLVLMIANGAGLFNPHFAVVDIQRIRDVKVKKTCRK